jgi:hypothetical protein
MVAPLTEGDALPLAVAVVAPLNDGVVLLVSAAEALALALPFAKVALLETQSDRDTVYVVDGEAETDDAEDAEFVPTTLLETLLLPMGL